MGSRWAASTVHKGRSVGSWLAVAHGESGEELFPTLESEHTVPTSSRLSRRTTVGVDLQGPSCWLVVIGRGAFGHVF